MRAPSRLVIAGRVLLLLLVVLSVLFVLRFRVTSYKEVFRALGHYTKQKACVTTRFEWAWKRHDIDAYVREASSRYGVDERLIHAVIEVESHGRAYAISRSGACGLMQIMPTTVKHLKGGNPFDRKENIDMGTRYLAQIQRQFKDNITLTIAAYNAGPGAVSRSVARGQGIPNNGETPRYVEKVKAVLLRSAPPVPSVIDSLE